MGVRAPSPQSDGERAGAAGTQGPERERWGRWVTGAGFGETDYRRGSWRRGLPARDFVEAGVRDAAVEEAQRRRQGAQGGGGVNGSAVGTVGSVAVGTGGGGSVGGGAV